MYDIAGYWCVPDAGAGPGGRLLHTHLLLDVCLLQVRSCRGWDFIEITSAWPEVELIFWPWIKILNLLADLRSSLRPHYVYLNDIMIERKLSSDQSIAFGRLCCDTQTKMRQYCKEGWDLRSGSGQRNRSCLHVCRISEEIVSVKSPFWFLNNDGISKSASVAGTPLSPSTRIIGGQNVRAPSMDLRYKTYFVFNEIKYISPQHPKKTPKLWLFFISMCVSWWKLEEVMGMLGWECNCNCVTVYIVYIYHKGR